MPAEWRRVRCVEKIAGVEYIVAVKLITATMQAIGARLEQDVHDATRRFAVFGALVGCQNFEFLNGLHAEYQTARQVERRHAIREGHVHSFLEISVINRP